MVECLIGAQVRLGPIFKGSKVKSILFQQNARTLMVAGAPPEFFRGRREGLEPKCQIVLFKKCFKYEHRAEKTGATRARIASKGV